MRALKILTTVLVLVLMILLLSDTAYAYDTSFLNATFSPVSNGATPYVFTLNISNATNTNNATYIFFNGHARSDYGDVRAVLNNVTDLPYWIYGNKLYVNVTSNGTVGIYYNNPSATTTADGSKTFLAFENFTDGDYTANPHWEVGGGAFAINTSGGQFLETHTDQSYIFTNHSTGTTGTWEVSMRNANNSAGWFGEFWFFRNSDTKASGYGAVMSGNTVIIEKDDITDLATNTWSLDGLWHNLTITRDSAGYMQLFLDEVSKVTATDTAYSNTQGVGFWQQGANYGQFDNVRYYQYPGRAYATFGTERSAPIVNAYTVSGYVFDNNNVALNGATAASGTNTTTTNAQGYYSVSMTNGTYNFSYTKSGFNTGYLDITVNGANVVNQNITITDTTGPNQVTGLTNNSVNKTTVGLTWTQSSDAILWGYEIFRNNVHLAYTQTNSYLDSGLTKNTQYSYIVRANDTYNNWGTNSSTFTISTTNIDEHLLIGLEETPGSVMKVGLDNLTNESLIVLPAYAQDMVNTVLIDGDYAIAVANSNPGQLWKIYIPNWTIVQNMTFNVGENASHHVVKWKGNYYVTAQTNPGMLVKINATNFTEVQSVTLTGFNAPQRFVITDVTGSTGGAAFIAGNGVGQGLIRVNLTDMTTWGTLGFDRTNFITLDNTNSSQAFAFSQDNPAMRKINLNTFTVTGTSSVATCTNPRQLQSYGNMAYVTCKDNNPSQVLEYTTADTPVLNRTITYTVGNTSFDGLLIYNNQIYGSSDTNPAQILQTDLTTGNSVRLMQYTGRQKAFWMSIYTTANTTSSTAVLYTPPNPSNLANTSGVNWINHTWLAGSGNITDSYNVSVNGTWHNGTATFYNNTGLSPHTWSNITVYAYNGSSTGSINSTSISQNTRIANRVPVQTAIANQSIDEGQAFTLSISATDADLDTLTYATNANKGSLNTDTGVFTWNVGLADAGEYTWYFSSSDGYGGVANQTVTIIVNHIQSGGGGTGGVVVSGGGGGYTNTGGTSSALQQTKQFSARVHFDGKDVQIPVPLSKDGVSSVVKAFNLYFKDGTAPHGDYTLIIIEYNFDPIIPKLDGAKLYFNVQPQFSLRAPSSMELTYTEPVEVYQLMSDHTWLKLSSAGSTVQINSLGVFAVKDVVIIEGSQAQPTTFVQKLGSQVKEQIGKAVANAVGKIKGTLLEDLLTRAKPYRFHIVAGMFAVLLIALLYPRKTYVFTGK